MKKLIPLCAFLLIVAGMSAQQRSMDAVERAIDMDIHSRTIDINEKSLAFGLTEREFKLVEPQAYVNFKFVKGNIYHEDKAVQKDVLMRYNAYSDEIEIKKSERDQSFNALTKSPDIFVKIGVDIYVYVTNTEGADKGGYFQVLTDGKRYDLYKKVTATFKEAREANSSYGRDVPPSFSKSTTYYLVDHGTFLEMPSGKKKIMAMMESNKKEMSDYVKKNKLNLDKEDDLMRAIVYFDSIQD